MKGKIVLLIFIISIGLIVLAYFYIFRATETDISGKKAEYKLTANELFYKFEEDENQANTLYLGKIIEISGTIISIQETENNELMLMFKEKDEVFGVACTLENKKKNQKLLKVGKQVTLKGVCQGYLSDVIVNNCVIL